MLLNYVATAKAEKHIWSTGVHIKRIKFSRSLRKHKRSNSGVASYGALGHVPPRLPTISFLVYFGVNSQLSKYFCSLRDQLVQMSTTHSSFDQYCISHKTISHRAAAAAGPEVRRECPII